MNAILASLENIHPRNLKYLADSVHQLVATILIDRLTPGPGQTAPETQPPDAQPATSPAE